MLKERLSVLYSYPKPEWHPATVKENQMYVAICVNKNEEQVGSLSTGKTAVEAAAKAQTVAQKIVQSGYVVEHILVGKLTHKVKEPEPKVELIEL